VQQLLNGSAVSVTVNGDEEEAVSAIFAVEATVDPGGGTVEAHTALMSLLLGPSLLEP
jgi:hypothetical protein